MRMGIGAALLSAMAAAAPANAAEVLFDFSNAGTSVASGSFSYADSKTGLLGYGDLQSFDISVAGVRYTLADVNALSDYKYFAYDTGTSAFVPGSSTGVVGPYPSYLSATNNNLSAGFFFDPRSSGAGYAEYSTAVSGSYTSATQTAVSAAPEPGTWALMIIGFGGVGGMLRRQQRQRLNATSTKVAFA